MKTALAAVEVQQMVQVLAVVLATAKPAATRLKVDC
jgi:hypothetical protein